MLFLLLFSESLALAQVDLKVTAILPTSASQVLDYRRELPCLASSIFTYLNILGYFMLLFLLLYECARASGHCKLMLRYF